MPEKTLAIFKEAPPNRRVSSAKSAWLIGSTPAEEDMLGMVPTCFPPVNFLLKVSAIIIYRKRRKRAALLEAPGSLNCFC